MKLAVFDLDSTLIRHEMIDEFADLTGKGKRVRTMSKKSNTLRLSAAGLHARARHLKGLPVEKIRTRMKEFEFYPHFEELVEGLRQRGFRLIIVSGAFWVGVQQLRQMNPALAEFDDVFCNHLQVRNGKLTGKAFLNVAENKQKIVRKVQEKYHVQKKDTLVVGDSAGDVAMFKQARVSVAFHPATPKVKKAASYAVESDDLRDVLMLVEKEFA